MGGPGRRCARPRDRRAALREPGRPGPAARPVVDEQLPVALELAPDLVSFHAGPNDALRPGTDIADVLRRYDTAVARLRATGSATGSTSGNPSGSTVLLFTVLERAGGTGRTADRLAARFGRFNDGVRATAR